MNPCHVVSSAFASRRYAGIPYSVDMGGSWFQGKYYENNECNPLPVFNMSGPDDYTIF